MIPTSSITGLILCGGAGSRLGGIDKGLANFHGVRLVDIAIGKLRDHVATLMISANRNIQDYAQRGYMVLKDQAFNDGGPHYDGPLAGILAGLTELKTDWMLVVPCDCPLFPHDIVERLVSAHDISGRGVYVRDHPSFALIPKTSQHHLETFLQHGKRKLGDWLRESGAVAVSAGPDESFKNLNRPEDFSLDQVASP